MLDAVLMDQSDRESLWVACVIARRRNRSVSHELNSELCAYCVVLALNPDQICHVIDHTDVPMDRAIACMAYRMAAYGIQLVAE